MKKCSICGTEINIDSTECTYCGKTLNFTDKILPLFDFKGRMNRLNFIYIQLIILFLYILGLYFYKEGMEIIVIISIIPLILLNLSSSVKRLHDINFSGWLVLIWFIPFIDIAFGIYLMIKKGNLGKNNYGE